MFRRSCKNFVCLIIPLFAIAGCSSLPVADGKPDSRAFAEPHTTTLGQRLTQSDAEEDSGVSRFELLVGGLDAFKARLALAEIVERSLDIQCYIWTLDDTGHALLQRALLAADRGVRVRILLDDVHAVDDEAVWLAADAHPNLEVRMFNPYGRRNFQSLDILLDGVRLNRRMHNKLILADGAAAILGGRNIGDHYFGVDTETNFRDLDLLVGGAVVPELGANFDKFWNSRWALPVTNLAGIEKPLASALRLREELTLGLPALDELLVPEQPDSNNAWRILSSHLDVMHTASAQVLFDAPEKVALDAAGEVAIAIDKAIGGVNEELLIETAYFIPKESGLRELAALVENGARVVLLTNSLATNDVAIAHAGYKNYQRELLENGISVFELRPDERADRRRWSVLASDSIASLHTKAMVFDRRDVFIGSFNFDPRSRKLNTENGLLVNSPRLAGQIAALIEAGTKLENSYELVILEDELHWKWMTEDGVILLDHDPETSAAKRAVTNALRLLPVEDQL